jgi:cytochrome c-type protein NapC
VLDGRQVKTAPGLASGGVEGGKWTVVFTRKLGGDAGSHALVAGTKYNVGFALHDDYTDRRFHYVSFGYSMALDDPSADINVVKQ